MTQEDETRCPFCGGPLGGAAATEAAEIHRQIRALQERLRQIEERLYPATHPPGLWGGYGADDTPDGTGPGSEE